jgi:tetratricopeptide (TPR) repeat protein
MNDEYAKLTDAEKLQKQILELSWNPTEEEQKVMAERIARPRGIGAVNLYYLALVRLLAGDEKGYRETCDRIVREADSIDAPLSAEHLSRALSVRSAATIDTATATRLAEKAVAADPKVVWYVYALVAAQYRAGRHDEAIRTLEQSLDVDSAWLGRCQTYAVLAMACQKLDRHDEAREWMAKAKAALVELEQTIGQEKFGLANSNHMGDWLAIQILLPEAEALLATGQ